MAHRGPINPRKTARRLSEDAVAALVSGDVQRLLNLEKQEFGGFAKMMADDDDDDDDDDDNPSGDGNDDDADDDDNKDDKSKKSDKDDDDEDSDREKLRKRMQAADRRAADAERRLKEIEDAKKDDLTKATDQVTELETKVKELTETVNGLRLQNAFLTANKHSWHDPEVALDLARSKKFLEDVVDEEGEVDKKALTKALDRLATEHKYLVKAEDKKEDEPGGPSGASAGGRSDNSKDTKAKEQALKKRFPILSR